MLTWILDLHVDRAKGRPTPFVEIAESKGHQVYRLRDSLIPKPIDLSNITVDYPTIVRGSHGFVNHVQNTLNPIPGGFINQHNFNLSTYAPILTKLCVNHEFEIIEYGDFKTKQIDVKVFVKPFDHLKKFNGIVVKPAQSLESVHTEKFGYWIEPEDYVRLSVSPVIVLKEEYRVVVVDGKAITGSTYDSFGNVAPKKVLEFADYCASIWNPETVYTIDIAETKSGYQIVEYNQFSTSAMYNCNQLAIVDALEKLLT